MSNGAARVLTRNNRYYIRPVLVDFHWFHVKQRTEQDVLLLSTTADRVWWRRVDSPARHVPLALTKRSSLAVAVSSQGVPTRCPHKVSSQGVLTRCPHKVCPQGVLTRYTHKVTEFRHTPCHQQSAFSSLNNSRPPVYRRLTSIVSRVTRSN